MPGLIYRRALSVCRGLAVRALSRAADLEDRPRRDFVPVKVKTDFE
jgi:hypothetical protein